MLEPPDDGPPPFTPIQEATIRKIGRKNGARNWRGKDFVHDIWLEVKRCWAKVPRVEPDYSKYVFTIARNFAIDGVKASKEDALTHALHNSDLEANPGLAESVVALSPGKASPDDKVLAEKIVERANERDPEATNWLLRTKVDGETFPAVAADVGQPEERVKKRVNRLSAWLKKNFVIATLLMLFLYAMLLATIPGVFGGHDKTTPDDTSVPRVVTPRQRAVMLRSRAFAACEAEQWDECRALLDEAKSLDPAGDSDPRVQKARDAVEEAETPPAPPPQPPGSDRKL